MIWAKGHEHCVMCGTTDVAHNSHGRCRTCDSKVRSPSRWPRWLHRCLRCGNSRQKSQYRKHGLCWACVWALRNDESTLNAFRLKFCALRPRTRDREFFNALVLELVQTLGVGQAAETIGERRSRVSDWASYAKPVPKHVRPRLAKYFRIEVTS